jgi:hypothetical protein
VFLLLFVEMFRRKATIKVVAWFILVHGLSFVIIGRQNLHHFFSLQENTISQFRKCHEKRTNNRWERRIICKTDSDIPYFIFIIDCNI